MSRYEQEIFEINKTAIARSTQNYSPNFDEWYENSGLPEMIQKDIPLTPGAQSEIRDQFDALEAELSALEATLQRRKSNISEIHTAVRLAIGETPHRSALEEYEGYFTSGSSAW